MAVNREQDEEVKKEEMIASFIDADSSNGVDVCCMLLFVFVFSLIFDSFV